MPIHQVLDPGAIKKQEPLLCALGIMTKAPQAGKVKTRLSPPLTPDEAAEINKCFLRDMAGSISRACQQAPARGVGVYTPLGSEAVYENILSPDFVLISQRGRDFGERLYFAAKDLFAVGFESVCLINSDSPTVPSSSFAEAANVLARPGDRVVLGPSEDGGYYLIGLKQAHGRFFEDIAWSTERVFEQTVQRAGEMGIAVHELPPGFDVDDEATLRKLCRELLQDESAAAAVAPNTRAFLMKMREHKDHARLFSN